MTTFKKSAIIALIIETVCMALLWLGQRDWLAPFHLDFLALAAMLLHLGGILITIGRWVDSLDPSLFTAILFFVQWFVWIAIVYAFLLIQEYCRRKHRPRWKTLSVAAVITAFVLLLVSQWDWPQPVFHASHLPRAPKGVSVTSVKEKGINADFFQKPSDKPQKVVVLLGGSEGGKSWSDCTDFIEELVNHGFCVLSLAYFGSDNLPTQLRDIPLEYFGRAFDWLSTQRTVIPGNYAVVGGSRGGELALLLGSYYRQVKAVVAIAPSSVVVVGYPQSKLDAIRGQHSSWSHNGRELPFLPMPYSWVTLRSIIKGPQKQMFEQALRNSRLVNKAAIPVENIQGPILLTSFTRDEIWPSTPMSEQVMRRLAERGFRHQYEHVAYEEGHCRWNIESCRKKIMSFLNDWSQAPAPDRLPDLTPFKPQS